MLAPRARFPYARAEARSVLGSLRPPRKPAGTATDQPTEDPAGLDLLQGEAGQVAAQAFEHVAEGLAARDRTLEGVEDDPERAAPTP